MQALFAYSQSKESHYNISKHNIDQAFAPDLNSMEVQDSALLKQLATESKQLFEKSFLDKDARITSGSSDKVNQITQESIESYHDRVLKDRKFFRNQMVTQAEKIFDRYVSILKLFVDFADFAESDKKINGTNFVKNLLIKSLRGNKSFESVILKNNISWSNSEDEVKSWYKELFRNDKTFIEYLELTNPGFEQDAEIVQHLVKSIFKSELFNTFMEEEDINWSEDKAIVRSMVLKTLKEIDKDNPGDFELMELSYNWEDDRDFFKKLYDVSLDLDEQYKEMIAQRTKNWDIDRLAAVDRITLEMAVAEMINFPSIPVKVTINEYIELAKNYSTPKSKQFINGILDTISKDLMNDGSIRKSGRGLIDNR